MQPFLSPKAADTILLFTKKNNTIIPKMQLKPHELYVTDDLDNCLKNYFRKPISVKLSKKTPISCPCVVGATD